MLVAGQLFSGAFLFGMSRINGITMGVVVMAMVGLGCGCLMPATTKLIINWFPLRDRATMMGLKQSGVNIAGIATGAILPTVALAYSWRFGFMLVSLMAIGFGLISLALHRDLPEQASSSASPSAALNISRDVVHAVFLNKNILLLGFGAALLVSVEMSLITHLLDSFPYLLDLNPGN